MDQQHDSLKAELESLKATSTRQSIQAEQALHELATKLSAVESQLAQEQERSRLAAEAQEREKSRAVELKQQLAREREERRAEVTGGEQQRRKEDELEREKRELLSVYERSEADKAALEESLSSLRALHTALQSSHSSLEASLLESTTSSRASLLRVQTLSSTLSSLEADKSFLSSELSRGRAEWSTFRREKHAALVRVQAELENSQGEEKDANASLTKLKAAHEGLSRRYEEVIGELAVEREERGANEANFVREMGAMRRLVEMLEKREEERKVRVEEVERGLEDERRSHEEREEELREKLSCERERSDGLELRCTEMREALERPSSYGRDDGDVSMSPGSFALSPSAQMAARGQKSGRSYAEVYGEYIRMEEELARERAESKRLGECLSQILGDIEERAPLLKEQRMEYDRLSLEATHLATSLADALAARDAAARTSESHRLDLARLSSDNALLSSQLRDLGRQVRTLMRSLAAYEYAGIAERSVGEEEEEEERIRRRADEEGSTNAVVEAHLVTFRTLDELQVQNQKLLRITREMGAQMEKGEEDAEGRRKGVENAAVEEAHELILRLKDEIESQRAKTDAFVRERDMFRRMLSQRGEGGGAGIGPSGEGEGEAARGLADVQANFDAYREEMGVDTLRLRDDLTAAQREAGGARTDLAKAKAQLDFMSERFRLITESFELQKGEMSQMSKRTLQLQQNMAQQDMATHRMTEDVLELRSTSDQLRHENTNLRSERDVWKSVENRLIEENAALGKERAHLADLMRNLQTMQNELERSGSESRRRLEDQVARLESQAAELKEKLAQETDAGRQLALRKELEGKTYQDRLDKLTADSQTTREALVAARTSQEHLELRVADLVIQITARDEKLAIYKGRSRNGAGESTRTREEELEVTVADLRTELRATKGELERATAHVQQYQAIAEAEGESLRQMTATYDEYKVSTDGAVAEKELEVNNIRERLHSLTTDLTAASTQNSELHRQIEAERTSFEKERKTFEDAMVDLRSADKVAQEAQLAAKDDLRRQAQIAREAHEKYERELVAHADDVKRLTEVKDELEGVRGTIREHQTAAEVARANLTTSEASWSRQKTALEQEISDLKKRCDDLNAQNAVLHQHLESFGSQAAHLQSRRPTEDGAAPEALEGVDAIAASHDSSVEQLREVIRYLRREKDIVDLQLEFSKQEAARLRQQLEFTTRNLEDARQSLTEERQKNGESTATSAQHAELLDRIHAAKLLRESNQTLRDENESNMRRASQLDARLRQAIAQLDPLKEQVQTLQAEVESKEQNIKLLEEDNERWKTRNQSILAKYERIDPAELQVLKDEVDVVKAQLAEAEKDKAELKAKVAEQTKLVEEQTKLADSMRTNWTNSSDRFKVLQGQARVWRQEKLDRDAELAALQAKVATGAGGGEEQEKLAAQIAVCEEEKRALEARLTQELAAVSATASTLEASKAELVKEKEALQTANSTLEELAQKRRDDCVKMNRTVNEHAASIETLKKDLEAKASQGPPPLATDSSVEETVRQRVAQAEALLAADRDAAIAAAVASATSQLVADRDAAIAASVASTTSQLQTDLLNLRIELAAASDPLSASSPDVEAVKAQFEEAKQALIANFETVKLQLGAGAKAREAAITERFTAEIAKASAAAKALPATAPPTPPVDVDALVQAKLAATEKERSMAQAAAIEKAVATALEQQAATHKAALAVALAQVEKMAALKNALLQKRILAFQDASSSTPSKAAPPISKPAPAPAAVAPSPVRPPVAPILPLAAARTPSGPSGAGKGAPPDIARPGAAPAARGPQGGAPAGRAAPQAVKGGAPGPKVAAAQAAPPVLTGIRGAARGGVLGTLLQANAQSNASVVAGAPKRAREEEATPAADGDLAKRLKQAEPPNGGGGA